MKYTVVTRTVTIREQVIEPAFGPLVPEKNADQLVRLAAKGGNLVDAADLIKGDVVKETTNVSSVKRGAKVIWGNKPAEKKPPVSIPSPAPE
jgi:hypothetical protein